MKISRRDTLKALSAGAAAGLAGGWVGRGGEATAEGGRVLDMNLLGYSLGTHIPGVSGVLDLLPAIPGYAPPKVARLEQVRTLTQTLVAGATEVGETDPITVFSAVEQGADLKIIGHVYMNTSHVFVANADRVQSFEDLEKPGVTVAINGRGVVSHVMLVGPLLKRGVDLKKVTLIEIGGSGARTRALLSGRVDAIPMHFDQAARIQKEGNFKVLLEPWKEYKAWIHEVWAVNAAWLRKEQNQRAAVDLMKAVITAFRRANTDFPWYVEKYRKHATIAKASEATEESLRPLWQRLSGEVGAWPASNGMSVEHYRELLPVYKVAEAVAGTVKVEEVVDTAYVDQALAELKG